jgi:hypothetical protein
MLSKIKQSFFLSKQNSQLLDDGSLLIKQLIRKEVVVFKLTSWQNKCQVTGYQGIIQEKPILKWMKPPPINLITSPHNQQELPVYQYLESIPSDIRNRIGSFYYRQIELLQVCSLSKTARRLLQDNPVLLWLWVGHAAECNHRLKKKYIKYSLKRKHYSILSDILGRRAYVSDIRLLKKLQLNHKSKTEIGFIRELYKFHHTVLQSLSNLNSISFNSLDEFIFQLMLNPDSSITAEVINTFGNTTGDLLVSIKAQQMSDDIRDILTRTMFQGDQRNIDFLQDKVNQLEHINKILSNACYEFEDKNQCEIINK